MKYLPEQMSNDEIKKKVEEIAVNIGAQSKKDFGKLMSATMKELSGKADGNIVRKTVEKVLSES
jgi:uncharacterized protein YqeY